VVINKKIYKVQIDISIMSLVRNTLGMGLIGVLFSGCYYGSKNIDKTDMSFRVIEGIPISVSNNYAFTSGSISTVLKVNEKLVLACFSGGRNERDFTKASALIQSEIFDGDEETIRLEGKYNNSGVFNFKTLDANGYKIEF
jgi:hypothetical protein